MSGSFSIVNQLPWGSGANRARATPTPHTTTTSGGRMPNLRTGLVEHDHRTPHGSRQSFELSGISRVRPWQLHEGCCQGATARTGPTLLVRRRSASPLWWRMRSCRPTTEIPALLEVDLHLEHSGRVHVLLAVAVEAVAEVEVAVDPEVRQLRTTGAVVDWVEQLQRAAGRTRRVDVCRLDPEHGIGCGGHGFCSDAGPSDTYPTRALTKNSPWSCSVAGQGLLRAGGRYWDRTSDLFRVREARYRCANRPWVGCLSRWVRDLNPCIRICSPLPRLSANPPADGLETRSERTTRLELATSTLARLRSTN